MSIENYAFSESNQLKNPSFRLRVEFTESPKSVEMTGLIKYTVQTHYNVPKLLT